MKHTEAQGFVSTEQARGLQVHRSVDALFKALGDLQSPAPGDFSRI
jgi:hypothetical protein